MNSTQKLRNIRPVDNDLDSKGAVENTIRTLHHVRVNLTLKSGPKNLILF